ncbi:MAG: hypothetical protein V4544_06435 [Pseudomonadota bacterium]
MKNIFVKLLPKFMLLFSSVNLIFASDYFDNNEVFQTPLIGGITMNYLTQECVNKQCEMSMSASLCSLNTNEEIKEENNAINLIGWDGELTIKKLLQFFPHLAEILKKWESNEESTIEGAKIKVVAWINDISHKEKINGFDYITFHK